MKSSKKNLAKIIAVIFALLLISFILAMKSGFNFFLVGGHQSRDGDVFRYIGVLMTKGYVPYRDIFDHKGPVLYFIQYMATFLGEVRGIWPIELVFLTGSVFISYAFARKFNNRILSILVVLLTFSRWLECGYGNCVEEFSMLFQLISVYFFVDFYLSPHSWLSERVPGEISEQCGTNPTSGHLPGNKWFDLRVMVVGICFACVFFMKANFCTVWIVFCLAILIHCIKGKYWESLRRFIISFLVGALLITIPVFVYLISNGAFSDFIYDYFVFNGLYTSSAARVNIETVVNSFVTFTNTIVCILAFVVMAFKISKRDEMFELDVVYTVFMVVSVILVTISGQTYVKMEIALLSIFLYPFSILFNMVKESNVKYGTLSFVVIGCLIISVIYPSWSVQVSDAAASVNKFVNEPERKWMYQDKIVNYIKDNTEETDKISVYGNQCVYYLYSEREPVSKYIFLPNPTVDSTIIENYFEDLRNDPPKVIVKAHTYAKKNAWVEKEFKQYLKDYGYSLGLDDDYKVYIRE